MTFPIKDRISFNKFGFKFEELKSLLLYLIAFRICNVFLVKTSFVPDEYWQTLEVAHHSAFGYGDLTWEWQYGLRSYLYPSLFSLVYRFLAYLHLDYSKMLIYVPRIIQAIFSGFGEWYFYRFVKEHFGVSAAKYSLFALLCNWFWWYCATRTIINSLECSALCIGLFYYPWEKRGEEIENKTIIFKIVSITICVIRPTAAVVWVPLVILHIMRGSPVQTFMKYMNLSLVILMLSCLVDFVFYGRSVLVLWNFFVFNFVKNLGVHFGSHPWHWYVTQGIPAVFASQLVIVIYGTLTYSKMLAKHSIDICKHLFLITFVTCLAYSYVGHKEFRFILHLVPIGCLLCGIAIDKMTNAMRRDIVTFLLITNVPLALYTGLVHQSGPLKIMEILEGEVQSSCASGCHSEVLFLMPCHTTPLYSHLHTNISVRYIKCLPNLQEESNYSDESGLFYHYPPSWLDENIFSTSMYYSQSKNYQWILIFDSLLMKLKHYSPLENYRICGKAFHTHFPEDRTGSYIYLLCKIENLT